MGTVMEMVVYLDLVVGLNGLLDYLLLCVCGRVTASPLCRWRLFAAAAVGGLYAGVSLLPEFSFLGGMFWQIVFGALLCLIAFGPGRCLLRQCVVLFLLAAAFSGLVLVLTELFSAPGALVGGRVYYPVSLGVLLLTGGGSYGVMKWGLSRLRHQGGDVAELEISLGENRVKLTALRDTGNTLRDPISGWGVAVADWTVLHRLLPQAKLRREQFAEPAGLMELLREAAPQASFRLIPYKAVGVEHGLLLALRPEEVKIGGRREQLLVGFSPVGVSDGGGYEALLGGAV